MGILLSILASAVEIIAVWGADAASTVAGYEPEIPKELE